MSQFKDYAKIYNLMYQDKNYLSETSYVLSIAERFLPTNNKTILELGCGTGNYSRCFSQRGYSVTGIDLSESMIQIAKNNNIANSDFLCGDIRSYSTPKKFPLIISLFHVFSYLNTAEDIIQFFENAYGHLEKDGLLIFDCWNGEGVLYDLPGNRNKEVENENYLIKRATTANHKSKANTVDVNFDFIIEDKVNGDQHSFAELHKMRYFFADEIIQYSQDKFTLLANYAWLKEEKADKTNWYALYVLRKK
jgi:SAM-dependent methyltransferase